MLAVSMASHAFERTDDFLSSLATSHLGKMPGCFLFCSFSYQGIVFIMDISQIVKSNAYRPNSFTWLDVKSKLREFFMQYVTPLPKFSLISGHHHNICNNSERPRSPSYSGLLVTGEGLQSIVSFLGPLKGHWTADEQSLKRFLI